jgi:hypothetical protein
MAAWSISAKFSVTLMNRTVAFLQAVSAAAVGVHMLRFLHAHSLLLPISLLPDDECHTANYALICLINVLGNQEAAKGQDSPIMTMRPDVVSIGDAARVIFATAMT